MAGEQREMNEPTGSTGDRGLGIGPGIGTALLMTACGIGLGMLTAPDAGRQTRKRLRKGLSTLGGEVADRWEDMHDRYGEMRTAGMRAGKKARKNARKRYAQWRENTEDRVETAQSRLSDLQDRYRERPNSGTGGFLTMALGIAAGAGIAYFMMADEAAPARSKVQEMATGLREQATERWDEFRRGGSRASSSSPSAEYDGEA